MQLKEGQKWRLAETTTSNYVVAIQCIIDDVVYYIYDEDTFNNSRTSQEPFSLEEERFEHHFTFISNPKIIIKQLEV